MANKPCPNFMFITLQHFVHFKKGHSHRCQPPTRIAPFRKLLHEKIPRASFDYAFVSAEEVQVSSKSTNANKMCPRMLDIIIVSTILVIVVISTNITIRI